MGLTMHRHPLRDVVFHGFFHHLLHLAIFLSRHPAHAPHQTSADSKAMGFALWAFDRDILFVGQRCPFG